MYHSFREKCSRQILNFSQAKEDFIHVAEKIGRLQKESGLPIPVEDYVEQFHFNLMEVVFEWARGMVRLTKALL